MMMGAPSVLYSPMLWMTLKRAISTTKVGTSMPR